MLITHRLEYSVYMLFVWIARIIGYSRIKYLARFISLLFFYLVPIRKKVVLNNLKIAFPEKSEIELKKIARENYYYFALSFLEIPLLFYFDKTSLLKLSDNKNIEIVKDGLKENKGLLLLTAHFGNWELGALLVGIEINKEISVLAKRQKNNFVADKMQLIREKFGNKEVLLGVSVRELYKTLRNGGAIGIVGDQRAPKKSGIIIKYFNRDTLVFAGAASLAVKLKSPIYLILLPRLSNGNYQMVVERISYENLPDENEAAVQELTQRYFNCLEKYVRQYPAQWLWMHKIWKN
ncbi:MAG: lysophospholipid acyltransferase family protein [Bacteroidetes bacterium]|nr:lysophospholipid acyltransferase family protein [Bacteroidota bacterium]